MYPNTVVDFHFFEERKMASAGEFIAHGRVTILKCE